jgi:hypothetical protein
MEETGLEPSIVSRNLLFDLKHNTDFTPIPPVLAARRHDELIDSLGSAS